MKDEKEEIKPAPLGESSEELKQLIMSIAEKLWNKWSLFESDRTVRMTKDLFTLAIQDELLKQIHSPTSEPPEEQIQAEQNALILGTLLDLNDQCYHYMKANPPDKTKMTYNSWESILEQLQYYKSEYGTGKAPEEQEELWNFMKRNSNGHTEFRVVVMDDGKAYAHVLGRDSETFDFKI